MTFLVTKESRSPSKPTGGPEPPGQRRYSPAPKCGEKTDQKVKPQSTDIFWGDKADDSESEKKEIHTWLRKYLGVPKNPSTPKTSCPSPSWQFRLVGSLSQAPRQDFGRQESTWSKPQGFGMEFDGEWYDSHHECWIKVHQNRLIHTQC